MLDINMNLKESLAEKVTGHLVETKDVHHDSDPMGFNKNSPVSRRFLLSSVYQ